LVFPSNNRGQKSQLSNFIFYWNLRQCEVPRCSIDEIARAYVTCYVIKGNWTNFTAYAGVEISVTLFANQTVKVGPVTFSDVTIDGTVIITVNLKNEWQSFNI
jgi:hypothetical protein